MGETSVLLDERFESVSYEPLELGELLSLTSYLLAGTNMTISSVQYNKLISVQILCAKK